MMFHCARDAADFEQLASEGMQTVATVSISLLLSYGVFRHRNGARAFDTAGTSAGATTLGRSAEAAVSKVVFVICESMVPMFILNLVGLVLHIGVFDSVSTLM